MMADIEKLAAQGESETLVRIGAGPGQMVWMQEMMQLEG
jgi:hypothetical protein